MDCERNMAAKSFVGLLIFAPCLVTGMNFQQKQPKRPKWNELVSIIVYSWSTFRENVVVTRLPSAWVGFWNKVTQYNFLKCERISDVKCTFSSEFHRPFFSIVVVVCFSRYGRFVSIVSFWSFRLFRCGRFGRFGSFACFVSFRCFGF